MQRQNLLKVPVIGSFTLKLFPIFFLEKRGEKKLKS